jgi:hypothetical protein
MPEELARLMKRTTGQIAYEGYWQGQSFDWANLGTDVQESWQRAADVVIQDYASGLYGLSMELENITARLDKLTVGVNTIGAQFNTVMEFVAGFQEKIANMGPGGMLKAMMGGAKNGDA